MPEAGFQPLVARAFWQCFDCGRDDDSQLTIHDTYDSFNSQQHDALIFCKASPGLIILTNRIIEKSSIKRQSSATSISTQPTRHDTIQHITALRRIPPIDSGYEWL